MRTVMTTRLPILLTALAIGCCPTAPPHVCTEVSQRTFTVGRVVDGDTFKVTYDGRADGPPERGLGACRGLNGKGDGRWNRHEA